MKDGWDIDEMVLRWIRYGWDVDEMDKMWMRWIRYSWDGWDVDEPFDYFVFLIFIILV